jgi:prolyl-tRNA synthetase
VEHLGVEAGFIGPMESRIKTVADEALKEGVYISGANRKDYHMKGIVPGRHFNAEWMDLHEAREGDACDNCGSDLRTERCIEIGNIFKLGTKYSETLKAYFLDEAGNEHPIIMGSYGIGPARIMAAAVEQGNDKDGIIWPESISPFDVHIIPLDVEDKAAMEVSGKLYEALGEAGFDVIMDDRDLRAGVKFKDADLIGVPRHVVVGKRGLKEGVVEIKDRRTMQSVKVGPEQVVATLRG